jgi:hypothetical protein
VINDAALEYMREHALAGTLVQRLATHKRRRFADEKAWSRHLERLGIADLPVTPDPVRVATEGALWGAVNAHGFLCEAVLVIKPVLGPAQPDPWDAGQFNVGQHALCWIHTERLVHKLGSRPPRRPPRARQDLQEARHCLLGLSRRKAQRLRQSFRPAASRPHPLSRTARLTRQRAAVLPIFTR